MSTDMMALRKAAEAAEAAWQDCECAVCALGDSSRYSECERYTASIAADEALERAEDARRRTYYVLSEDGQTYDCHETLDAAREAAREADAGDYDTSDGTVWSDRWIYEVRAESQREAMTLPRGRSEHVDTATVTIQPEEPECSPGQVHDWQTPHAIVGGIEENPGVHGHGGGVYVTECCVRCGCRRVTDTWAQRSDTGEQGLRSVSYDKGYYTDALAGSETEKG